MMSEYKEIVERIISDSRGEELLGASVVERGKGAVLAAVHEIQDHHEAARELERSLLEIPQVFLDMASSQPAASASINC
ncbi:hypothetical protein U9M48_012582 [Paspalum notatum var. saurae]|uniref:Uncharacterized protein n=1 Tax=Paspalum notatum var. saurae TaxID=547442 RepID=A0AAQ3WIN7_PASNO